MLLEREHLLEDLSRFVADSAALGGGVVVVGGEAGIGKTSLVRALLADSPGPAYVGRCDPLPTPRPLQPLHDVAHQTGGRLAALMASDVDRHECFSALLDVMRAEASLVVVEDVHWADDASLDLLVHLSRRLADTPSSLLVTVREPTSEAPPRLPQVLAVLGSGPRFLRLTPAPLSLRSVELMAQGTDADATEVLRLTDGNPFFVTEVLATRSGVPSSVRDAVLARTVELPLAARAVLETAAVVPDRVELDLLRAVGGATPADLEACERAGLLEVTPRFASYRHELARVAVLESLPVARTQALHAAVVAHLLGRPGVLDSRIAHHADLAGDSRTVLDHAVPAAEHAARLGSHREAGAQLVRALNHLDAAAPGEAAAILSRAALVWMATARLDEAYDANSRALVLHRDGGDLDALAAQLALHSRILWSLGRSAEARSAVVEATRLGARSPGSRGELSALSYASILHMLAREVPEALETGHRAIELARTRGDTGALARSLNAVGTASWFSDPDLAEPFLVDSLETGRRARDDVAVSVAMLNLGSGAGEIRRYDVARTWLERCVAYCRARDLDFNGDYAVAWLARVALETGSWDEAGALATQVLDSGSPLSRMLGLTVAGRLGVRRGDAGASDQLEQAWEIATGTGDLQRTWPVAAGRAEAAWAAGRPEDVGSLVGPTLEEALRLGQPWAVGELAWWCVRVGGPAPTPEHVPPAYAAMLAGDWTAAAHEWDLLRCPYDAALARAESTDRATLEEASASLHRLGARHDAARVAQRMRSLGLPVASRPRRTTAANPAGLTDRELEVASLLATGATNKDIAGQLFISPRTTAHHVSAVMAKLGVHTRREAGAALAKHGHE